jgi:hypothetical protein
VRQERFGPSLKHSRRSSRDSRQAARSNVETKPGDTFIVQQSRGAKSSGAEVLYFAEKWRAIQNKLRTRMLLKLDFNFLPQLLSIAHFRSSIRSVKSGVGSFPSNTNAGLRSKTSPPGCRTVDVSKTGIFQN